MTEEVPTMVVLFEKLKQSKMIVSQTLINHMKREITSYRMNEEHYDVVVAHDYFWDHMEVPW